jgi:hypothetical protein
LILFRGSNAHDLWWAARYGSGTSKGSEYEYKTVDGNSLVEWLETHKYTLHNK